MLAASAALTLLVQRPAERHGGRAVLLALSWLVVVAGVLLATARGPALVILAAMLGNVAVSTGETGKRSSSWSCTTTSGRRRRR